ncbi:hypothetical protein SCHPADRAFT_419929 [Schizopora paradoxa]|uniref:Uncharacterized protein n=1 Tax=Schizopora paradoxa TaxID=27342 RepID=A0A0H2S6J2_9AGAM|nr:hypothetical protein SCHPADRAFT_419929 [Schizopora paradoxa]
MRLQGEDDKILLSTIMCVFVLMAPRRLPRKLVSKLASLNLAYTRNDLNEEALLFRHHNVYTRYLHLFVLYRMYRTVIDELEDQLPGKN